MTPDELRAYEQALDDVENPITHPVGAPGSPRRRANDLGLRLKGYEQAWVIERERRETAESDAVEDAANAELQLQGALAAQKQAEERADGAEKDARDAAELMREAFALRAKAEERAERAEVERDEMKTYATEYRMREYARAIAQLAIATEALDEALALLRRSGNEIPSPKLSRLLNALASQPADERGEERKK